MRLLRRKSVEPPEPQLEEVHDVRGWRRMQILPMGILASPQQEDAILSQVSEPAKCRSDEHAVPFKDHCGWYAMYRKRAIQKKLGYACVAVSAIGETELCREGFQAYQIRIDEIWVDESEPAAKRLGERYECPVYQEEKPCKSESESSESSPPQNPLQNAIQQQYFQEAQRIAVQEALRQIQERNPPSPFQQGTGFPPGVVPPGLSPQQFGPLTPGGPLSP